MSDLEADINNHEKHYSAVIRWLKRRDLDAFALCGLFATGKTVAHAIWERYDALNAKRETYVLRDDRCKECAGVFINFPYSDKFCRFCGEQTGLED